MRVAAVRYINTLPLVYGLRENPAIQLTYETPAVCYQKLVNGEVDVGLIPVIGTQMNSMIRGVKGLGIASVNRCGSVLVFSKKPLDRVQDVVLDSGSLTSVVLLKIILRMKYGNDPTFHSASVENIYEILREHDALLVIGDQAILTEKTDFDHYDLATEWHSLTRLPFVFAFWATNRRLTEQETKWLSDAYEQAEQNWEQIYGTAREVLCVDPLFLKRYYNVDLHYRLSRSDYEGLIRFFSLARDLRLIEKMRKDIWV